MTSDAAEQLLATFPEHSDEWNTLHQLIGYRTEYLALQRQLASPPAGWFPFGHHIDIPDPLEFWGDQGGIPLWERPTSGTAWHSARPGEVWFVEYDPGMHAQTGYLNVNGPHVVYEANGGQLYFRRLQEDGAKGRQRIDSALIVNARKTT